MSDEWQTDEPEIGQIATIIDEDGAYWLARFTKDGWSLNGNDFLAHDCVAKWQPIVTPEEQRLRDLLRWRETAKEPPNDSWQGDCVVFDETENRVDVKRWNSKLSVFVDRTYYDDLGKYTYWRPIGTLPGGE